LTDANSSSNKRTHSEYALDVDQDEDGEVVRRMPGFRAPQNVSTRQSIEDVTLQEGACWRCKLLRKPVSIRLVSCFH